MLKTINIFLFVISFLVNSTCFSQDQLPDVKELNRPNFQYKTSSPPIPSQSINYINIANYNIRTSYKDNESENCWDKRKEFYLKTIQTEDEARQIMQFMRDQLHASFSKHFPEYIIDYQKYKEEKNCQTCLCSKKEPFPVFETKYYRIALKTSYNEEGILYGNFPYPFRLIIALKKHSNLPSEDEWKELRVILDILQTQVCHDLKAEYASYGAFQDIYYKNKNSGKKTSSTPHFFMHFIFRFPNGIKIKNGFFKDPNPYDQFEFQHKNLVKENVIKENSNFIYKRIPDIITIQELTFKQAKYLKEQLPQHHLIGYTAYQGLFLDEINPDTKIGEILAITYRADRFVCLDHGVKWISPTPNQPSIGFGSSRERIIIWAKFKDTHTGRVLFVFNAHYDHLGGKKEYVDAELAIIDEIAKEDLWFSAGERFYKSFDGEILYNHYLNSTKCYDVRDKSLLGHYGEAGSWGGFSQDLFAVSVKEGCFECDTLDVCFTNSKQCQILFSYSISGAYDPIKQKLYDADEPIKTDYQLASDHFMSGFYIMLDTELAH